MKTFATLLFTLVMVIPATAGSLDAEEKSALRAQVAEILAYVQARDAQPLLAATHPAVYTFVGGKEQMRKTLDAALSELSRAKARYIKTKIGTPSRTWPAGDEELCIVPVNSLFSVSGKKMRSRGYLIAIRTVGKASWKFVDGAGLAERPDLLYKMFPRLPPGIELPPNTVESL